MDVDLIGPIRAGQVPLIDLANPPDWTRPEWFLDCPNTPHIDTELHRDRLLLAVEFAMGVLLADGEVKRVADFGAGDGGLLERVKAELGVNPAGIDLWGYDLAQPSIDYAFTARGINIEARDVIGTEPEWPDLLVATEFLEHLVNPFAFVKRAHDGGVAWIVASSPWTETLEHHYPLHAWAFDLPGYRALLEDGGFEVVDQETTGMFQVVLAVRS